MKKIFIFVALLLTMACSEKRTYTSNELKSEMYITNITYFDEDPGFMFIKVDSLARKTYCVYKVSFKGAIITGENNFSFIDSIGVYNIGDKFPQIK